MLTDRMRRLRAASLVVALCCAAAGASAQSTPPAGKRTPHRLAPGQYKWAPDRAPSGPVVVIVDLPDQMAYVYRDGIRIGVTTVSTGRSGHATPTGVFTILQKQPMHHSTLYDDAPMPFMERLTWSGVCLHAGGLPGYPSSHGCVHLPLEFSKLLYGITSPSTTVVIADTRTAPQDILHPGLVLPEDTPGTPKAEEPLAGTPGAKYAWQPDLAPEGPLAILISGADQRVYVYRNGVQIGEGPVHITDPTTPLTPAVYTMLQAPPGAPSPSATGIRAQRWMRVDLPAQSGAAAPTDFSQRVRLPKQFAADLNAVLVPGTTLMVTDRPATSETRSGPDFVVMQTEAPQPTK
jgi:hypothetical protein